MPQTIEFEKYGLSIDFPDHFTGKDINAWIESEFDGKEAEIKRGILKDEMQSFNRDSSQYQDGAMFMNSIGSLTDSILGGVIGGAKSIVKWEQKLTDRVAPGLIDKALGFDPWDALYSKLKKAGHEISETTQVIPADEMGKFERFFSDDLMGALGSGLVFIGGGYALRGQMTANAATATLGALMGYSSGYDRAIDAGDSEDMANFLGLLNAGVGLSEALPVGKWIDRINGKMGWTLGSLLTEAGEEAAQEFFQSGMEDLIASIGNEDLDLMETLTGALYNGLVGGVSGGILAGGTAGVSAARGEPAGTVRPRRMTPGETARMQGTLPPAPEAAGLLEDRRPRSERVFAVDPEGRSQPLDTAEDRAEFIEGGDAMRSEFEQDLAAEQGAAAATPAEMRQRRLARARERVRQQQQQAEQVMDSPDYGGRGGILAHATANGMVADGARFEGRNVTNRQWLRTVTRAMTNSLKPQNAEEKRVLNEYLAKRKRAESQTKGMAVADAGQESGITPIERRLFNNHLLHSWLSAAQKYIEHAEMAGDTKAAENLRGQLAEQLGLKYDPNAEGFPEVYANRTVLDYASDPASEREQALFQTAYPMGSVVSVASSISEGESTTGTVIGHKVNISGALDLKVQVADGSVIRVPAGEAMVVDQPAVETTEVEGETTQTEIGISFFGQTMEEFEKDPPVSVTYDLTKSMAEQGIRETQLNSEDMDVILQSMGLSPTVSKRESLSRAREARNAILLLQKSDSAVDDAVPAEQLDDWAELFRVQNWKRRAKKSAKIKKLRKATRAAANGRRNRAVVLAYGKELRTAAREGVLIDEGILATFEGMDPNQGAVVRRLIAERNVQDARAIIPPAVHDRWSPELREGHAKPLPADGTIPIIFNGYGFGETGLDSLVPYVTWVGNWTLPSGRVVLNGSTAALTADMVKSEGLDPVAISQSSAALGSASLDEAVKSFLEANAKPPKVPYRIDLRKSMFDPDTQSETGIDINQFTKSTRFKSDNPVFIKPTYTDEQVGGDRIGFADVGYSARDTKRLNAKGDDLATKWGANPTRKAEEIIKPGYFRGVSQATGDLELFKPSIYVVLFDTQSRPMGHYTFATMKDAKGYLLERLENDGVKTLQARRPIAFTEMPKPEPDPAPESDAPVIPEELEVRKPFSVGPSGEIPMQPVVNVSKRPDWGPFTVEGPITGHPGIVRIRSVDNGMEVDISSDELTTEYYQLPPGVALKEDIPGGTPERTARNPMGRQPGDLQRHSMENAARIAAMQAPLNVTTGELATMNPNEIQTLANQEAFGDVVLLGLRVGRHLGSETSLNHARSIRESISNQPEQRVQSVDFWDSVIAGATGQNQSPETARLFGLMESDTFYIPRFGEAGVQAGQEGFSNEGQPSLVEEIAQEAGFKTPLQVISRKGDGSVTVRDTVSGEVRELGANEVRPAQSQGIRADTGTLQFEKDLVEAGEDVEGAKQKLAKQSQRKLKRIANSHVPLSIPVSSFEYYTLDDFLRLAEQEGQGDLIAVAYRVGRNLTSITELNKLYELARGLSRETWDVTPTMNWNGNHLTQVSRVRKLIEREGEIDRVAEVDYLLGAFYNRAIEAATGVHASTLTADDVELWDDPTYSPPFQCASPCKRNQEPQSGQQKCPDSTVTPDTESSRERPTEPVDVKRKRRKRTKSIRYLLLNDEWVRKFPSAFKELRDGTYYPRSFEELRTTSRVIVDQWDDGIDGLRELAEVALSNNPKDRWWNVSDDLKPAVLVEIAERLDGYAKVMAAGSVRDIVERLESNIWHNVQMMGSISGQMLNTYRMLWASLNRGYFVDKVVRRMFSKAEQEDTFELIRPKLNELKKLADAAPKGTPTLRIMNQINELINQNLKHTAADYFWALWYNNVLSSVRTQFDNATMAFNVVMEAAINMAANPGSGGLALKAVMNGFRYGVSRFGQISKGDYSGRLGDPYEMLNKFDKDMGREFAHREPLKAWQDAEQWWKRWLSHTSKVTHFMSAMDNVVAQGGFELRANMRAWQMARDQLKEKGEAYAKEGKPWNPTAKEIEELKESILKTTPEDLRRYREQAQREAANGDIQADEVDLRVTELKHLGYPRDIIEEAEHYGKYVTGTSEPTGVPGHLHRIITNQKGRPDLVGNVTRAVFPFTRWAADWTNIIMDYMPPISLYRMYVYSPNSGFISWATRGKVTQAADEKIQKFLRAGDAKLSPMDYQLLRVRALVGFAAATSLWALFSKYDDDDEPYLQLTGGLYNLSPQRRNQLREQGVHPWSIVIGGRSFSYRNVPIAAAIGVVANMKDVDRYGGDEEDKWKVMGAVFRGGLMVKDMSVLSGFSELLDVLTNNRWTTDYRKRSLASWLGRFGQGTVPLSALARDFEAWAAQTYGAPVAYTPTTAWGTFLRDWPLMSRLTGAEPALNLLGEPVNVNRLPWGRQVYPRRNDPVWDAIGVKAGQGVFLPAIITATVTESDGTKRKMTETEEYRYKSQVYQRMGDEMRRNYLWFRSATPEAAQRWLDRTSRQIRETVRADLGLR